MQTIISSSGRKKGVRFTENICQGKGEHLSVKMGCSDFSDEPTNPSPGEGWHGTCVFVLLSGDSEDSQTGSCTEAVANTEQSNQVSLTRVKDQSGWKAEQLEGFFNHWVGHSPDSGGV